MSLFDMAFLVVCDGKVKLDSSYNLLTSVFILQQFGHFSKIQ